MTIDTNSCYFNSTPIYFTSMAGTSGHWILTSYTAIYGPSLTAFRVYARAMNGWNSTQMVDGAQIYSYDLNWVGIVN